MKFTHLILSNMPNGRHPLSWLTFILILLVMIPVLLLMVVLIPVVLIINMIKMKFFPNKNPKTFVTPFGFARYSQAERTVVNYAWHNIEKVEVWAEGSATFPVLLLKSGEPVKLKKMSVDQIKALCAQHQITFHEEVVIVQDA